VALHIGREERGDHLWANVSEMSALEAHENGHVD
jgi:hypothetical protein